MGLVIDQADKGEEKPDDEAMAEHLQGGTGHAHQAQGEYAQHHIAHMADAAICDQPLQVPLPQGYRRPIDYTDQGEGYEDRGIASGDLGEYGDADSNHAVAAHLDQDASEDDAHRSRGIGVGIGEPGMKREDGQLHRKSQQEQEEDGSGHKGAQGWPQPKLSQHDHIEGAGMKVEQQDAGQHHGAAGEGINNELYCRILLPPRPPDGDE